MFGKNQTRWYIYTWVLFSTHVWILTHMYGKRHTCVKKATQLYVCKCLTFSTHVWEKPLTCLFPPELSVSQIHTFTPGADPIMIDVIYVCDIIHHFDVTDPMIQFMIDVRTAIFI